MLSSGDAGSDWDDDDDDDWRGTYLGGQLIFGVGASVSGVSSGGVWHGILGPTSRRSCELNMS